jgi:hypothetical protein
MSGLPVLDETLAEVGAETGALLAASHAERQSEGWTDTAKELFELYAIQHPDGFMTEEVRAWAEKLGFEPPPDNRAWGYIAKAAAREGVVRAVGFAKQRSATCHGSPKTIWKLNKETL